MTTLRQVEGVETVFPYSQPRPENGTHTALEAKVDAAAVATYYQIDRALTAFEDRCCSFDTAVPSRVVRKSQEMQPVDVSSNTPPLANSQPTPVLVSMRLSDKVNNCLPILAAAGLAYVTWQSFMFVGLPIGLVGLITYDLSSEILPAIADRVNFTIKSLQPFQSGALCVAAYAITPALVLNIGAVLYVGGFAASYLIPKYNAWMQRTESDKLSIRIMTAAINALPENIQAMLPSVEVGSDAAGFVSQRSRPVEQPVLPQATPEAQS